MRQLTILTILALATAIANCDGGGGSGAAVQDTAAPDAGADDTAAPTPRPCDAEPEILTTPDGVEFVRTPVACFEGLPDWPYAPHYVEIDGLRQAYVDEGPADGPVVLLLHGQPSWAYLYRKMIPVLSEAGFRVIAMDHLGMGRSDKPIDIAEYSYLGHNERLERFIEELGLTDIRIFVQDWGSLIGLRVAGLHPEWFSHIAVGDGMLPLFPAGLEPFPPVEDPDEVLDIESPFTQMPAQQVPVYDGCEPIAGIDSGYFGAWMIYAMKAGSFHASEVVEAMTWFDLPEDVEAAYDAPFPSRIYMAGPRTFPSLVNEVPGTTEEAWVGLRSFEKPFITIWAANDPGNLGQCDTQETLISSVPGAAGWPHARLPEASHFLQDDQGTQIAQRLVRFLSGDVVPLTRETRYCEILLVEGTPEGFSAEVYGTQHLNECPAAAWEALDPDAIQAETGVAMVKMNGPRRWMPDAVIGHRAASEGQQETFGDLLMNLLATVEITGGQALGPYQEAPVQRSTTYVFNAGQEVYELTDPDGKVYVLQAMSQIVDPDLTPDALPDLGAQLALPAGWTYAARSLDAPLVMRALGEAIVIQDELENTYQRLGPVDETPSETLPVLDDGTGTVCASDAGCDGFEASSCLMFQGDGYCTIEGCAAGDCGAPYQCCHDCDEALASLLPFEGSACLPGAATGQLTTMAGCTCD